MNIVGISGLFHDAAVAVVRDGQVVCAAQEERFTRRKHDGRLPTTALEWCLDAAGIEPGGIDHVVFYEKPVSAFARSVKSVVQVAPRGFGQLRRAVPSYLRDKLWVEHSIERALEGLGHQLPGRLLYTEHHVAHAASAFYPSPFDAAAVVTLDGVGEWATTTIGHGKGDRIEPLRQLRYPHSIGLLYSAFTQHCGFRVNGGEYKLMGLAPYGEPTYRDVILSELIDLEADGSFHLNTRDLGFVSGMTMTNRRFRRLFGGPGRQPDAPLTRREADLARSIQDVTEEVVRRVAVTATELTGERRVCLAGGVALNAVANGALLRSPAIDEVWVQPAAGDAGGALGAALEVWFRSGGERMTGPPGEEGDAMLGCRLGPSYDDDQIGASLRARAVTARRVEPVAWANEVAGLLAAGGVVGLLDGAMEFGPRALGGRSILADPRDPTIAARINASTKRREAFRPFAPAVLEERAADWFDLPCPAPYMTFVVPISHARRVATTDELRWPPAARLATIRSDIPAVTHVDHSARVQTVSASGAPRFHALLRAFERATGCPVLLNTSLNVRGQPIACTPEDALDVFDDTDLDHLVLGNWIVSRE